MVLIGVDSRKKEHTVFKIRNGYVHKLLQLEDSNRNLIEYIYTFHGEIHFCKGIKLATYLS